MKVDSVQIQNNNVNSATVAPKPPLKPKGEDFETELAKKTQEGLLQKAEAKKDVLQLSQQSERILSQGEKSYIQTLFPNKPDIHAYTPEGKQVKIQVQIGTQVDVKG